MLHQYLENRLIKIFTEVIILASVLFTLFTPHLFAQDVPGLYESFESLIDIEEDQYNKRLEKLKNSISNLTDLKDANQVELDPQFLNHILFYSPSRYASLASKDRCSLYDLILSGHIQGKEGPISRFLISYTSKGDKTKTVLVSRNTFLDRIAYIQCPQSKTFAQYFQIKNLPKTLKTVFLEPPTSYDQCYAVHQAFINDYKTPYLCQIYEHIEQNGRLRFEIKNTSKANYRKLTALKQSLKLSENYKKILNIKSYDYLKNLCLNIENPKMFCEDFFNLNFWKRVANEEKDQDYILNSCKEIFQKTKFTKRQIQKCASTLTNEPDRCHYLNQFDHGLTPKPSCDVISATLNLSHLNSNYNDCPALTGNDNITTISRVLNHINKTKSGSDIPCRLMPTQTFAKFNNEASDGRYWGVSLCYDDKLNKVEECLPTLLGSYPESEYSMEKVVATILQKTRAFGTDQQCRVITSDEYKPTLLEFKGGCFIILSSKKCTGTDCKFKILNNDKEVTHIQFKSEVNFSYFPEDFIHESSSQFKLIENFYKKTVQKIINISFLKTMFKRHPNAIIQGIGCREDLLPTFFKKYSFNQCSPVSFIVDGFSEKDGILSLVVRSSYDSLHAPRLISWSYVFNAVKAYQEFHPINLWGFYAIY